MYASIYLKFPTGADIPLPVFFKVAAGGAFHIKIEVVVAAGPDGGSDTVFKPGIVKIGRLVQSVAIGRPSSSHRNCRRIRAAD